MANEKLCVNCRWYSRAGGLLSKENADCHSPRNTVTSVVTGEPQIVYQRCEAARYAMSGCGLAARWFEPREGGKDDAANG